MTDGVIPKLAALFAGFLLTIFISWNGVLAAHSDPFYSNMVFHTVGALTIGFVLLAARLGILQTRPAAPFRMRAVYLIPGVLGALTVILNNYILLEIGIVLMTTLTLLGQMLASILIDHFGWFGRSIRRIDLRQICGVALMFGGVVLMVVL